MIQKIYFFKNEEGLWQGRNVTKPTKFKKKERLRRWTRNKTILTSRDFNMLHPSISFSYFFLLLKAVFNTIRRKVCLSCSHTADKKKKEVKKNPIRLLENKRRIRSNENSLFLLRKVFLNLEEGSAMRYCAEQKRTRKNVCINFNQKIKTRSLFW